MGILSELGKAALQGAVEGIQKSQQRQAQRERQDFLREFMAHEQEIQAMGETGDLDALQMLTSVYYRQGDYQKATYWGRKGAAFDDAMCLYMMGEIAYAQGDFQSAANFFTRNINVNSDTLSATALGNMFLQSEEFGQAAYYFEFALRRDNSNGEAALGLALCKMNDENSYLEDIEELMKIAARSDISSTRDTAQQILQQIQAEQNRRSQQNSGCFITTAVCDSFNKPDDCFELTTFRKFRDDWLAAQLDGKALIAEYYSVAPLIVAKINRLADSVHIYKNIWQQYLEPCLNFIRKGDNLSCKKLYVEMVRELKARFC